MTWFLLSMHDARVECGCDQKEMEEDQEETQKEKANNFIHHAEQEGTSVDRHSGSRRDSSGGRIDYRIVGIVQAPCYASMHSGKGRAGWTAASEQQSLRA